MSFGTADTSRCTANVIRVRRSSFSILLPFAQMLGVPSTLAATLPNMEVSITSMSAVGPELHILLENPLEIPIYYALDIEGVRGGKTPPCTLRVSTEIRYWRIRRENIRGVGGSIPPHGYAHRTHAFGQPRGSYPCVARITLRSGDAAASRILTIDEPKPLTNDFTAEPRKIAASSWLEGEPVMPTVLVHTVVRNASKSPIRVAISRREVVCAEPATVYWDPLEDVPQGLSSGPAEIEGNSWAAFVSVLTVKPGSEASKCSAEIYISYERTRGGYELLKVDKVLVDPSPLTVWRWMLPVPLPGLTDIPE